MRYTQSEPRWLGVAPRRPRFYFDTRKGPRFTPDEEGMEFPNLDAGDQEAAIAAAEMGRDRLLRGDVRNINIKVRSKYEQRVLTVRVTMDSDRVVPPPVLPDGEPM